MNASATWLVCERICVPEEGSFRLDLPAGTPAPSAEAPLFATADASTPGPAPFTARVGPEGKLMVSGDAISPATVRDAWFMPDEAGVVSHADTQMLDVRAGSLTLSLKPDTAFKPDGALSGVLVVRDGDGRDHAYSLRATPGAASDAAGPGAQGEGIARLVLLALLGGLVLNLMPCVFPVLAMKAVGLAGLSGSALGQVRRSALSYTAGVLVSFTALAAALLALRAAGAAVGWGFQLQSPVFVACLAWLLFALGLNLSGVFQFGGGLAGAGQSLAGARGPWGSFFTGVLAVVVATPCTAPFMGVAIAGALTASPAVTLLIFLALGLGLAAPYALLAVTPGLARALPRPGPWMVVFKQVLAFPMYGAAVWLVWVLSLQAGPSGVLAALSGLVLVGFAAWVLGLAQSGRARARRIGQVAAAAALLTLAALLPGLGVAAPDPASRTEAADAAEPYTPARLAALRAEGRPVFLNMTAAWCVTCLWNERAVLSTADVRQAFRTGGVAYLKGDWTRPDPDIASFLRAHGRDGVPLYVLYPRGSSAPVTLPQLLTAQTVLDALDARGAAHASLPRK